jgi:phosphoribosyl 1,2-cyclic phosphate phosphodiesterase
MIVTLLGTGSPLGTPVLGCSCRTCERARERDLERTRTAIHCRNERTDETLLVDCGPDVRRQLADYTLPEEVVITHLHGDHCAGLDDIGHYYRTLPIHAADGSGLSVPEPNRGASVADVVADRFGYVDSFAIEGHPPGEGFEACGLEVTLLPVDHGRIACYGVRVEEPTTGASVAITSDTSYAIGEVARDGFADADLLVVESLIPAGREGNWPTDRASHRGPPTWSDHDADGRARSVRAAHLTEAGALALGADLDADRLALTHASHYYPAERAFADPLARDGDRWEL